MVEDVVATKAKLDMGFRVKRWTEGWADAVSGATCERAFRRLGLVETA